jgi:hypothetical protein
MAQSPKQESQDPLIGQSGVGQNPVGQKTDKEQRDGESGAAKRGGVGCCSGQAWYLGHPSCTSYLHFSSLSLMWRRCVAGIRSFRAHSAPAHHRSPEHCLLASSRRVKPSISVIALRSRSSPRSNPADTSQEAQPPHPEPPRGVLVEP